MSWVTARWTQRSWNIVAQKAGASTPNVAAWARYAQVALGRSLKHRPLSAYAQTLQSTVQFNIVDNLSRPNTQEVHLARNKTPAERVASNSFTKLRFGIHFMRHSVSA